MDNRIALYVMNLKGFRVLSELVEKGYASHISFVSLGRDAKVVKDFAVEMEGLCMKNGISCCERGAEPEHRGYRIAIGWRWIISDTNKLIVFHDSLLPKYRGFAPVVNALINNEKSIGATALFASDDYDSGAIISQAKIELEYPIKIADAIELMADAYSRLCLDLVDQIISNDEIVGQKQNESDASYSLWLDDDDYYIDWSNDAFYIQRFIDAKSFPYLGAKSIVNGSAVRIFDAEAIEAPIIENPVPGKVMFLSDGEPSVVCGTGLLRIKSMISEEDGRTLIPFKRLRSRFYSA
jgi:methionyl-tRNA formyltransferase